MNTAETRVSYGEVVTKSLVVVGNGMVGQKLLESAVASGLTDTWQIVAFGEECRPAYDRVHLSAYFDGYTEDQLRFGVPKISSPAHKQAFDLRSGVRLDDPTVRIPVYPVRAVEETVQV